MPEIFSVAIDASGKIVKIARDLRQIEKWADENGRRIDCLFMSFISFAEYFEYCTDYGYDVAISE